MGSGMLPGAAYVTQEHEYILLLRKGGRRPSGSLRPAAGAAEDAFFWEERNPWFSDIWEGLGGKGKPSG